MKPCSESKELYPFDRSCVWKPATFNEVLDTSLLCVAMLAHHASRPPFVAVSSVSVLLVEGVPTPPLPVDGKLLMGVPSPKPSPIQPEGAIKKFAGFRKENIEGVLRVTF